MTDGASACPMAASSRGQKYIGRGKRERCPTCSQLLPEGSASLLDGGDSNRPFLSFLSDFDGKLLQRPVAGLSPG